MEDRDGEKKNEGWLVMWVEAGLAKLLVKRVVQSEREARTDGWLRRARTRKRRGWKKERAR